MVITSSITSITSYPPPPGNFYETDWNEGAIKHVEANGEASDPNIAYCAGKTLAEKGT